VSISRPLRLVLRNRVEIGDALATTLEFIERDGSYRRYDLAPVKCDGVLTEADVRVANRIVARMPERVVAAITARAPGVNRALADIPAEASLLAMEDDVPWVGLEHLLRAVANIDEVGLPRATKVLHRKRPALIPILDSVVVNYLRAVERLPRHVDLVASGLELIRAYKRELDANARPLRGLRAELRSRGVELTECRLLDLLLWAYSGTYMPAWQRTQATTPRLRVRSTMTAIGKPTSPTHPSPAPFRPEVKPSNGVLVFRDDEAGYLAWIARHRQGFVLNANRSPTPRYLILHRASCWTITGRPSRGAVWTSAYLKVCADDEAAIERWAQETVGTPPRRCSHCRLAQ
jgi:hypothetical protein